MSDDVERIDVQAVNSPRPAPNEWEVALCSAGEDFSEARAGRVPALQMDCHAHYAGHLLSDALAALGSRSLCTRSGGAYRSCQSPLLFLLRRNLATGILLRRGPAHHGGPRPVLVTSVAGRAWCGYTCPQTVWVDLYLVVERAIEGDRNARMKLDKGPWTFDKIWKRVTKHSIWIVIGVLTGGAWIFYFADAPKLLMDFVTGQAAPVAYFTVAILTATTYVFGGLMREQVCTYMCPWPRIQAAMLDENSLTVTYNDWRGEPRSRHSKKAIAAGETVGDCVDCNACVAACPMGIDIRDGQQLECITCALCIDACNSVMDKIDKPRGLISYATLADYDSNMALATNNGTAPIDPARVYKAPNSFSDKVQNLSWKKVLRPRSMFYFAIWALIGLTLVISLSTRQRIGINVLHDRTPQYVLLSDGSIRNGYTVKLLNMIPTPRTFRLSIEGLPGQH